MWASLGWPVRRRPAGTRPLVSVPWIWSKGWTAGASGFWGLRGGMGLADLDRGWVAVEAEDSAAGWGDVWRGPGGIVEDSDGGLADGFEACEAVVDLGGELGFGCFRGVGGGEGDFDEVFLGDSGDSGAGGFGVWLEVDGVDEAEVDDVAGDFGVVAVAEGEEDVGFG